MLQIFYWEKKGLVLKSLPYPGITCLNIKREEFHNPKFVLQTRIVPDE